MFKEFVLIFEQKSPQVHKLHDKLLETYRHFLACYIRPEVLSKEKILTINPANTDIMLPTRHIYVGGETETVLKTLNSEQRKIFMENVKKAYSSTSLYMQKKLPLQNSLLISLSALDPIVRGHTATFSHLKNLCCICKITVTDELDLALRQYQLSSDIPPADHNTPLDIWWGKVLPLFTSLSPLIKTCLSIFTGPRVEQSFSNMNLIVSSTSNRMLVGACEAYQKIKYVLLAESKTAEELFWRTDIFFDTVDNSVIFHLQTAHSRWKKRITGIAKVDKNKLLQKVSVCGMAEQQRKDICLNAKKRKGSPLKGNPLKK